MSERGRITAEQYDYLMKPLRSTRIASRRQGGKNLSYLESWDVRAHLTRIFGFGNFDAEMIDAALMFQRDYMGGKDGDTAMWEVAYRVTFRLVVRDAKGNEIARYTEGAVGSASGSVDLGGLHDNALKTAASDALKRCAINLGTQFGLSLYDNGATGDVVRQTLVKPPGHQEKAPTPDQEKNLEGSVGVTPTGEATAEAAVVEDPPDDTPLTEEQTAEALGATVVERTEHVPDETPAEEPPTVVDEAEMTRRRREMFALFTEAGFERGSGAEARNQRLDYCRVVLDREVTSSTDLSYDDIVKVVGKLREVIDTDKAGAK